jgi:soluble lytic murein transglycosylase-like protein
VSDLPRPVLLALAVALAAAGAVAALLLPRLSVEPHSTARPAAGPLEPPRIEGDPSPADAADVVAAAPATPAPGLAAPVASPEAGPPAGAEVAPAPSALIETASAVASAARPPAPRLPAASRWALPPIMTVTAPAGDAAAGRRAARNPALALAPAVSRALSRGADASALAPLAGLRRTAAGLVLVLALDGRTVRAQATSLAATRQTLEALVALPEARRPQILLEAAPEDVADQSGPPPPRAGELATLVPIYQAAGSEYGIDWRVLAAINLVETGLGTNTNVSSAGAVGWMQFMPATWRAYGRDASGDGIADPHDPYDAIYSAARYLEAAGARTDLPKAIWAYNHADWYVRMVLDAARDLPAPFDSSP